MPNGTEKKQEQKTQPKRMVVQEGGPYKGQAREIVEYNPNYHSSLKKDRGNLVTYVNDPNSNKRYKVYGSRDEVAKAKKALAKKKEAPKYNVIASKE